MSYPIPFFTSALILAQTESAESAVFLIAPTLIAFDPSEPLPYWAEGPRAITVSLMTPDGGLLPNDAAADIYKLNSAGTLQLFARLTPQRPIVRIEGVGAYVVKKPPTLLPSGVDVDGYFTVADTQG